MYRILTRRHFLLCIFLLALILRICAIIYIHNFSDPDVWEDGDIAKNIIGGKGFSYGWLSDTRPTSFAAPFYPYFLALFYYLFGIEGSSYLMIQIVQVFISSLTCIIIYAIGRHLFDRHIGKISAMISAVYPVFIYSAAQIIRTTFIIFFLSLVVFLFLKLSEDPIKKTWITLGVACGIAILAEPALICFVSLAFLWLLLKSSMKIQTLKIIAYVLVIIMLIILPWSIRNYLVHNRLMLIKTQFGFALWLGNNAEATGTLRRLSPFGTPVKTWHELRHELVADKLSETECDDMLRKRALLFIKANPRKFFELVLRKFYYFWWFDKTHPLVRYMVYRVPYAIIFMTALLGAILSFGQRKKVIIIYLLFLSFTIIYTITYVLPRYRIPIEPYIIILSSVGFRYLYERVKSMMTVSSSPK